MKFLTHSELSRTLQTLLAVHRGAAASAEPKPAINLIQRDDERAVVVASNVRFVRINALRAKCSIRHYGLTPGLRRCGKLEVALEACSAGLCGPSPNARKGV
ncbi:MAG: hypothetical protein AAFO17_15325 [Pseudomonadota bacterium]